MDLLFELGLLRRDGMRYLFVDPPRCRTASWSPAGPAGRRDDLRVRRWANAFNTLGQTYRRSPSTQGGPVTEMRGDQIDHFLQDIVSGAQRAAHRPAPGRPVARPRCARPPTATSTRCERGVSMRTLYQHSARRQTGTREYVRRVTAAGAEVRTLDEFFNRLIVVDREVAIIPSGDDLNTALAIRDSGLIAYLVDIFERFWERGRPFTNREPAPSATSPQEQRAMAIRMLVEGHGDATCAKRLGVSPRTYAGYVAALKDEFEAQTRFQLGYRMGQDEAKPRRSRK